MEFLLQLMAEMFSTTPEDEKATTVMETQIEEQVTNEVEEKVTREAHPEPVHFFSVMHFH